MNKSLSKQLLQTLKRIDRPGSFCASGSVPFVFPGLEVEGLGPIGLPLNATAAKALAAVCEQAPYGKGTQTLVDTSVRRVWHLRPDRFQLTNSAWNDVLADVVKKVETELGLEKQLECHLYDLLLYEPGGFFRPHRDGEKLDRMVATLVIVLPTAHKGGELVVRHDGQEQVIDSSKAVAAFQIHYSAFYSDCEHEVHPLEEGHRLCIVYNLTLKKAEGTFEAPRSGQHVEAVAKILRTWAESEEAGKVVITLDHRYSESGLAYDTLKGTDRAKAGVLLDAASKAGCEAFVALLTFHEVGSAEESGYGSGGRRNWDDDDEDDEDDEDEDEDEDEDDEDESEESGGKEYLGNYRMEEVFDESLTAEHFSNRDGSTLPIKSMDVEEDELLDQKALRRVKPQEDFEGYTGNEGMTLERWYRHASVVVWPRNEHFSILCGAGVGNASGVLFQMAERWRQAGGTDSALHADCATFANAIIARWPDKSQQYGVVLDAEPSRLLQALVILDEPSLFGPFLERVLARDASVNPGELLPGILEKHGWSTYSSELGTLFADASRSVCARNVGLLEQICLARPRKKSGWHDLCVAAAPLVVRALEQIDDSVKGQNYDDSRLDRAKLLAALTRSLLATEQESLFDRLTSHALALSKLYPLEAVHLAALTSLKPWIADHPKLRSAALAHWMAECRTRLEALTKTKPQPPADWRRDTLATCKCNDCKELNTFLSDATKKEHTFKAVQERRSHLESQIRSDKCDLNMRTEKRGSPHQLVCTKNTASYDAKLKKYHDDLDRLATLAAIEVSLSAKK